LVKAAWPGLTSPAYKIFSQGSVSDWYQSPTKTQSQAELRAGKVYVQRTIKGWEEYVPLPSHQKKEWIPKNQEVRWPFMPVERTLSEEEWEMSAFPTFALPAQVSTKVNTKEWRSKTDALKDSIIGHAAVPLLESVLQQLVTGADSGVGPPGNKVTKSRNFFSDPEDCKKMADALATEVKGGNLSGPLDPEMFPETKINGFMAVPKASGDRRQVGNLSSPEGSAFNDGIPLEVLQIWPVTQTTARQFALKITRAGRNSILSKCDMVAAYKTLKVCQEQRRLQGFLFCGKLFIDLCLVFGDRAACMWFDRLHFCILMFFVIPRTTLPSKAVGETVDDITAVVPSTAVTALDKFVRTYREQLASLNIKAAPSDPACVKAFDRSREGEILGVHFSTIDMTWTLGLRKTKELADHLWRVVRTTAPLSLLETEQLAGKVSNFAQLAHPLSLLTNSLNQFLGTLLSAHLERNTEDRASTCLTAPEELKDDCRVLAAIVADTVDNPLPITMEYHPNLLAMPVHTDASGCPSDSPSLGIFVSRHNTFPPLVASLRFPHKFLCSMDKYGHVIYCKSTLLESLGYLTPMLLCPQRFMGQFVSFNLDSTAAVAALRKGKSDSDDLATTVIRATRTVAAALGCIISSVWVPRRSDRQSVIADDLTHNITGNLSSEELGAYLDLATVSFPPPVLRWMNHPVEDPVLGRKCVLWLAVKYPALAHMLSR
jgi:hypothetical protein